MESKCIYCNSSESGKGCSTSPHSIHIHFSKENKCIYCNTNFFTEKCAYNPLGINHVSTKQFVENFLNLTNKAVLLEYFFKILKKQKITENYSSPLDRFYKKIAEIISHSGSPFLEALCLHETFSHANLTKSQLIESVELKYKIKSILNEFSSTVASASLVLPTELVEKSLQEAIMSLNET